MTPTREDIVAAALTVDPDLTEGQLDHVTGRVDAIYFMSDMVRLVRYHMDADHTCVPSVYCEGEQILRAIGMGVYAQIGRDREEVAA